MKRTRSVALAATPFAARRLIFERSFDRLTNVIFVSLFVSLSIVAAAEATGETLHVDVTPGHTTGTPSHAFEVCVLVSGTEYGGVNISLDWDDDYFADEMALNVGPTTGDVHYCFQNLAGPYESDSDYFVAVYRNGSGTNPSPIYQIFDVTILPVVIPEVHDAIDASCTGWSIVTESSSFECDSGVIAGSHSGGGNRQGFASFSGGNLPSNMAANACQKAVIDEAAAGDLTDARPGFLFGGSIDDAAEGAVLVYLDNAFEGGKLTAETKYWTGGAVDASGSDVKCVSDETIAMIPGDVLVSCVDGTWGSGAEVHAWTFPAANDPCPGAVECQDADLGQPDAVLTESDCGSSVPGVTDGTAAGFYGLVLGDASLVFDGDYAAWEINPPPPFSSLAVAPESLSSAMAVGGAVPEDDTLTIGNDGNAGTIDGTLAVSGTPDDCQPTTGGNTSWIVPDDGAWGGASPLIDTTENVSYAGAADCEEGVYQATLSVACTSPADCDDDPQTVPVSLLVADPGDLGSSFPLGTYVHDWDCDGAGTNCPTYLDEVGWDSTEHSQFQTEKAGLVANVSTYAVGLVNGAQPGNLPGGTLDGTTYCPADLDGNDDIDAEDVSGLPTVTLPGEGTFPLISGCDFDRAYAGATPVEIRTSVVIYNSFLPGIKGEKDATHEIWVFDSLSDSPDTEGTNGIKAQGNRLLVAYSEALGGTDVWKVNDGHTCYKSHLHAYANTESSMPHYDVIQFQCRAHDVDFIGCNLDGPFRDSQNPFRGSCPGLHAGEVRIAHNIMSGGRKDDGNAVITISDKDGTGSWSGDLEIWNNTFLGEDDPNLGISWCGGSAITIRDDFVTPGSAYVEDNKASDGATSGNTGSGGPHPCTGANDEPWDTDADFTPGVQAMTTAKKDAIEARAARIEAWRAQVQAAAP